MFSSSGKAGENLVVSGVREDPVILRLGRDCWQRGIAKDLALLRDHVPEEGEEGVAPLFGRVAHEPCAQAGKVRYAALPGSQHLVVSPSEEFLPTKAIEGDEEDIFRLLIRMGIRNGDNGEQNRPQGDGKLAASVFHGVLPPFSPFVHTFLKGSPLLLLTIVLGVALILVISCLERIRAIFRVQQA
jgi:hypothetical protein